jgi:small-conductance mechanosensitive channel
MATYEELQADLEEAQRELNDVRRARKVGSNYRLLNGETITAEEYAVLQSDAKIALNNAKKAAKGPDESRKRIGELEKEINRLQKLVSAGRADQMTLANARVDINRYQQQLTDEQQKLESFGTAPRPGSAAGMTLRADVAAAERAVQPAPTPSEEKPKPPVGGTGGGTGGKGGKGDTKPEKPKGVAPLDIAAVEATSK